MDLTPLESIIALSRKSDPHTSKEAAQSQRATLCEKQEMVRQIMASATRPLTDEKLSELCEIYFGWPRHKSTARTRRAELVAQGYVEATGETVKLHSGRKAMTWRAK